MGPFSVPTDQLCGWRENLTRASAQKASTYLMARNTCARPNTRYPTRHPISDRDIGLQVGHFDHNQKRFLGTLHNSILPLVILCTHIGQQSTGCSSRDLNGTTVVVYPHHKISNTPRRHVETIVLPVCWHWVFPGCFDPPPYSYIRFRYTMTLSTPPWDNLL